MKKFLPKHKGWLWGIAWLLLLGLGIDFYNWGKEPHLILGLPLWLWQLFGLVLLIALVYGILSRVAWEDA
jgi:hypothetical protein